MKKSLILASVALLAMTVSCDLFKNTFKEQDVKVNETSNLSAPEFVGLKDSKFSGVNREGDLTAEVWGEMPLKASVDPSQPSTKIPGSITISGKNVPDAVLAKDGSSVTASPVAPDNAGIVISVKNPSDYEMQFETFVQVDEGKVMKLPPFVVPAKKDYNILFSKADVPETNLKDSPTSVTPDKAITVPEFVQNDFGKQFEQIEVKDITVFPLGTKAAAPAGQSADIEINAQFCALLSFPKGSVITICRSLHDLNIHLDRLNEYTFNKYGITLNVTNTIPFDIFASASNTDGITAVADKAVKAGSVSNPVETTAVITVTDHSGNKVSEIETADLVLKLTAGSNGARIPKDVNIKIDVDKITPLD